jgi:hypothetical protein
MAPVNGGCMTFSRQAPWRKIPLKKLKRNLCSTLGSGGTTQVMVASDFLDESSWSLHIWALSPYSFASREIHRMV